MKGIYLNAMNDEMDYSSLLKRARKDLPDEVDEHDRFQVPEADVLVEGNNTVIRNFVDIAKALNREPEEVLKLLLKELGTAGNLEGQRVILKGKFTKKQFEGRLNSYIDNMVLCSECGRPDTILEKEGRILTMRCQACGAFSPVKVKKAAKVQEKKSIQEGDIIEVMIQDVGKRGDGVAKQGSFIIYIPGTVKGEQVKIKIDNVRGTMAFAHPVRE